MSSKAKIGLLVTVHVIGGLLMAWASRQAIARFSPIFPNPAITIFMFGLIALEIAQAGMIGIWGGLSTTRLAWRLTAVVAATLYLWAILVTALSGNNHFFFINAFTLWTILAVLSGLHSRRKLRLTNLAKESVASEGFHFSIRHLLFVTAAVAVVLGIGQGMPTISSGRLRVILQAAILTPCLIMVALATLWAVLGTGRPIVRLAGVVPTAFAVGMIPTFLIRHPGNERRALLIWSAVVGLQTIITAVSLLVVRSCGWRLVESGTRRFRFRFNLRQIALLVSLVGVGFGTWHWLSRKVVVVRAATPEDEEFFAEGDMSNADLNHKRNVAVATGKFMRGTWLLVSLHIVQAGIVEQADEQWVGREGWWAEGPIWEERNCGMSLGEFDLLDGRKSTELTISDPDFEFDIDYRDDFEEVIHNITPVAKQTLPGTITPDRPHIVYVEGDQWINVDRKMTLEEFAEANPGNYLVVTVEIR